MRAIGDALAAGMPRRFAARPVLSSWSRGDVDELLEGNADGSVLRQWITTSRRQLRGRSEVWISTRTAEAERLGVDVYEVDRLAAAYNALEVVAVAIDGDRMTFACR
jgi:hypothetical protein